MKSNGDALRSELSVAKLMWGKLKRGSVEELRQLLQRYKLSIALGEIVYFNDHWYVTNAGLLRLAFRRRCLGIETNLEEQFCTPELNRWVVKAVVHCFSKSRRFVGYGDADPSNVSLAVHGAELRIAETRAVNRALRKAYGIGICSVEELGSSGATVKAPEPAPGNHQHRHHNTSNNGQSRLRDQLCILIRQHNLDATLVKAYAADFCGTTTLSSASRELVESFISHLSAAAKENHDGLICKLNSYARPSQVNQ